MAERVIDDGMVIVQAMATGDLNASVVALGGYTDLSQAALTFNIDESQTNVPVRPHGSNRRARILSGQQSGTLSITFLRNPAGTPDPETTFETIKGGRRAVQFCHSGGSGRFDCPGRHGPHARRLSRQSTVRGVCRTHGHQPLRSGGRYHCRRCQHYRRPRPRLREVHFVMSMIDFLMRRPVDLTLPSGFQVRVLPMSLADVAATAEEPDTYRRLAMTVQRSVCTEEGVPAMDAGRRRYVDDRNGRQGDDRDFQRDCPAHQPGSICRPFIRFAVNYARSRRISVSEALAEPWVGIVAYMGMEEVQGGPYQAPKPLPDGMTPAVFEALERRRERDNG